jgi:hypothetical protein
MSEPEQGRVPIILLKEGATETKGKDARKNNIAAAKLISGYSFQLGSKGYGQDVSRFNRRCNNHK